MSGREESAYVWHYDRLSGTGIFERKADGFTSLRETGESAADIDAMSYSERADYAESLEYSR